MIGGCPLCFFITKSQLRSLNLFFSSNLFLIIDVFYWSSYVIETVVHESGHMSFTKYFMENDEQKKALRAVLEFLLDADEIDHEVSKDTALEIIHKGTIKNLTHKQRDIFDNYIKPFIDVNCEHVGCADKIEIHHLPEAYDNRQAFGGLFCADCTHIEERFEHPS